MKSRTINVGVIGCGVISNAYFNAAKKFAAMKIVAVADIRPEAAKAAAEKHGYRAMTVKALLADPGIEAVLNLTVPAAHAKVNEAILKAGKHAYVEKPFATDRASGKRVMALAKKMKLQVGGAPDTFLGGSHQTCREMIDKGAIGKVTTGMAFACCHGHESWHHNPAFFYRKGGGPLFDIAPYHITALVNMLGPVKRVAAINNRAQNERISTQPALKGRKIPVRVDTNYSATLQFASEAVITLVTSYDTWKGYNWHIELHGTKASLRVPDPNRFGDPIMICEPGEREWKPVPTTHGYTDNMRSLGLADMCRSLADKSTPARCGGDLVYHVLDIMCAIEESSKTGRHIKIQSTCARPAPLPRKAKL